MPEEGKPWEVPSIKNVANWSLIDQIDRSHGTVTDTLPTQTVEVFLHRGTAVSD